MRFSAGPLGIFAFFGAIAVFWVIQGVSRRHSNSYKPAHRHQAVRRCFVFAGIATAAAVSLMLWQATESQNSYKTHKLVASFLARQYPNVHFTKVSVYQHEETTASVGEKKCKVTFDLRKFNGPAGINYYPALYSQVDKAWRAVSVETYRAHALDCDT